MALQLFYNLLASTIERIKTIQEHQELVQKYPHVLDNPYLWTCWCVLMLIYAYVCPNVSVPATNVSSMYQISVPYLVKSILSVTAISPT